MKENTYLLTGYLGSDGNLSRIVLLGLTFERCTNVEPALCRSYARRLFRRYMYIIKFYHILLAMDVPLVSAMQCGKR